MNLNALISKLDGLSAHGNLPPLEMHGYRSCSADVSNVFHIGYRNGGGYTPCLLETRKGYSFNLSALLTNPSTRVQTDVLFQLFRSYATYCAVSIVTANAAYVLATRAPSTTTRTQLAKYTDDISASNTGFRVNLYKDSRATIAQSFRAFLPLYVNLEANPAISAARSNAFARYALPSKWDDYFAGNNPAIFTYDLTRALDMIFRYAYNVGVDTIGLTLNS